MEETLPRLSRLFLSRKYTARIGSLFCFLFNGTLLLAIFLVTNATSGSPLGEWWDAAFPYRQQMIVQTGGESVAIGYSVALPIDHADLVNQGVSLISGDDLRLVRWNGAGWTEINRVLDPEASFNSGSSELWFALQADIEAASSDDNYFLYYGNPGATNPPDDENLVFHFADFFDRPPSDSVGGGWLVNEGSGDVDIEAGALFFNHTSNQENRPLVDHPVGLIDGRFAWQVGFDWGRSGSDSEYRLHLQLGNSAAMDNPPAEDPNFSNAGVGPSLLWASPSQGMFHHEGFGYEVAGAVTELQQVSGQSKITVHFDVAGGTYDVSVDELILGAEIPFTSSLGAIDQIRILCWQMQENSFDGRRLSYTFIRHLAIPEPEVLPGVVEEWAPSGVIPHDVRSVRLYPNYPNPFNPQTSITFEMVSRGVACLQVLDMSGRLVKELIALEEYTPGRHKVIWNGRDDTGKLVASGMYFYRLEVGSYCQTKCMTLVK